MICFHGYPSAPPFPGHTLHVVAPIELAQGIPPTNVIGVYSIYSNMTAGSSGGPWPGDHNEKFGYIFGLNSFKFSSQPNHMYSPTFGEGLWQLWRCIVFQGPGACNYRPGRFGKKGY